MRIDHGREPQVSMNKEEEHATGESPPRSEDQPDPDVEKIWAAIDIAIFCLPLLFLVVIVVLVWLLT